ncbi:hypothetical protein PLICRDRAFT_44542 [Plicaturopsis crispa FD-325 SS-3]|nr:hypothetical protein PLICRDRAFT_44542 [Plicaturopsis crispa FD-325 SS-3]
MDRTNSHSFALGPSRVNTGNPNNHNEGQYHQNQPSFLKQNLFQPSQQYQISSQHLSENESPRRRTMLGARSQYHPTPQSSSPARDEGAVFRVKAEEGKMFPPTRQQPPPYRLKTEAPPEHLLPYTEAVDAQDANMSALILRQSTADLTHARNEAAGYKRALSVQQAAGLADKAKIDVLEKRCEAIKDRTILAIKTSGDKMEDMKVRMKALKADSVRAFAIAEAARKAMEEHMQVIEDARSAHATLAPMLDNNGEYTGAAATKALIDELQAECQRTQDVGDILRGKLETCGADLIDARARVRELEATFAAGGRSIDVGAAVFTQSSLILSEAQDIQRKQGKETVDALVGAAEAHAKLLKANERIAELMKTVSSKNTQLEEARTWQDANADLRAQVKERDLRLVMLASTREEVAASTNAMNEQNLKLCSTEAALAACELDVVRLQGKLEKAATDAENASAALKDAEEQSRRSVAREHAAEIQHKIVLTEKQGLEKTIENLGTELCNAKKSLAEIGDKLQVSETQRQVLQQRLEDQTVTLRITREESGDLQERLVLAETTHATQLADARNESLRFQDKYEAGVSLSEGMQREIKTGEKRAAQAAEELAKAGNTVQNLRDRISALENMLKDATAKRAPKSTPPVVAAYPDLRGEVEGLKIELSQLNAEREELATRTATLQERYEKNQLDGNEKAFANSLIALTQSINEQDSVSKANELRRRDNTIKVLQQKIVALESTIARHLSNQAKERAAAGMAPARPSIVDTADWIVPSSPLNGSQKHAARQHAAPPAIAPPVSNAQVTSARPLAATAQDLRGATTTRATFARLASDLSDDIEDEPLMSRVTNLGKRGRDRMSPTKGMEDDAEKPSRRQRAAAHAPLAQAESSSNTLKPKETALKPSKTKRRK